MRIGLVGAGSMGMAHTPAWKHLASIGAELVGVVTNRPESTAAFAAEHGIRPYDSLDALMADVDIVDICSPTYLHKEMTLQAAAAGKHVICEKPIALTTADAQIMIDACEKAGVKLLIAHVVRFVTHYRMVRDTVANGGIGKPGVIRLTRAGYQPRKAVDNWFVDESRSGGMMLDLMIHDYDFAQWLGGDVTRVFAKSVRSTHTDAPGDYALVTLRFANGAIAHIEGGWIYPPGIFRTGIDIAGTEGVIEWQSDQAQPLHTYLVNPPQAAADEVAVPGAKAVDNPFTRQLRHFYECITQDVTPIITPQEALAALRIGLAARESAKTGQPVTITGEI